MSDMGWFGDMVFKIKSYIRWISKFIGHDIWHFNLNELSKAKARVIMDIKVVIDAFKNFADEKIGFQSVALSYFCASGRLVFRRYQPDRHRHLDEQRLEYH